MLNSSVFVIVPAFNEAAVLRETVAPLVAAGYRVVVVDDGSTDATQAVLSELAVVIIRHAVNLGQGAALQTGMDYALRNRAAVAVHFDADGQHSCSQIPDLIAPVLRGEADIVLGSRFLCSSHAAAVPFARRILLRVAILVNAVFTGLLLSDAHNGFRALSRKALSEIRLRENGFAHASEIVAQIRRRKLRFVEIPTGIQYSEYSRKKGQPFWNSFNIAIDLLLKELFR